MKKVIIFTILLLLIVCDDNSSNSRAGKLVYIEITPTELEIEIDSTCRFSAIGKDINDDIVDDIDFIWISTDSSVGIVDSNGLFTALSTGSTYVSVESGIIESNKTNVNVYDPLYSILIIQDSVSLYINSAFQLEASGKDIIGNDISGLSFNWEIEDTNIATINSTGFIVGVSEGNTQVNAKLRGIGSEPINVEVKQLITGTLTDVNGNIYITVKIGNQWWMAENLRVTHYRNGEEILNIIDNSEWGSISSGAYCIYEDNTDYVEIYGLLYNWYTTIDTRNIAPEGWHVPSDDDWKELELYIGIEETQIDLKAWRGIEEGGSLKEIRYNHWDIPNISATNRYGFTALPAGGRVQNGEYEGIRRYNYYWSSTVYDGQTAWDREVSYSRPNILRHTAYKRSGLSIRCVKD